MGVEINEAIEAIKKIDYFLSKEITPLIDSTNSILAKDIKAKYNLPPFDNSAMDGYALKDLDQKEYKVVTAQFAGDKIENINLNKDEAIRITTGAYIPPFIKGVVPIEGVIQKENYIYLKEEIKEGANIRKEGEDIQKESILISKGEKLTSYKIALLASQGYSYIERFREIKVAIVSSGNELASIFEDKKEHQLYNTNTPYLLSRIKELGAKESWIDSIKDNFQETIESFLNLNSNFDLIITTGGASVGEKDFIKKALKELKATAIFEGINVKPGKPTSLYKLDKSYILVLPGNPLAAIANFEIIGTLLIKKLQNQKDPKIDIIKAPLIEGKIKQDPKRAQIIFGILDKDGFRMIKKQRAGMLSPLKEANSIALILKNSKINQNQLIDVIKIY